MNELKRRMKPLLGTFVEIVVQASEPRTDEAIEKSFGAIQRLHGLLSFHEKNSDLSRLNLSTGEEVILDSTSVLALRLSRWMTRVSAGYFNCTVGSSLVNSGALPNHGFKNLDLIGNEDDILIKGNNVFLKRPVIITLDGIAKGLAVDLAIKALQDSGVQGGWVNAGGDMRIFGNLRAPVHARDNAGHSIYLGDFHDTALATSAAADSYCDRFPAQILGRDHSAVNAGIWSVLAPSAWLADALTKVAATAPPLQSHVIISKCGGRLI